MADRVVMITGAGGGLGRALAREAVARGDIAVAIGRDPAALAETGDGLAPSRFDARIADVRDHARLEGVIGEAARAHGRVDALLANAAIYPRGLLTEQPMPLFMETLAVNVGGVAAALRAALPRMMDRARGRVVVVGSYADRGAVADSGAYAASKGALHALVRAAAAEVGADFPDLLVNEWVPGSLATRMGIAEGIAPDRAARWGLDLLDLPAGGPTGQVFVGDRLEQPPLSFKRRLLRKLRGH